MPHVVSFPASWVDIEACAVTVPAHVVFRDLAMETVLLNIKTGQYHGIDRIGARFFAEMRSGASLRDVAAALATEFGQDIETIRTDLTAFVNQLAKLGLVELVAPAAV